jgi:hypothetical protein
VAIAEGRDRHVGIGAAVYFDSTPGNVTSVSTRGNKLIGAATQCAGASDAVAIVRLKLGLIDYNGCIEVRSSLLNVVLHEEPHINT